MRVVVKEPMQVKTYTWCVKVPPRCTKYKTEMRDKFKIQVRNSTQHCLHLEADLRADIRLLLPLELTYIQTLST
jgi:hypothetical protein